MNDNKFHFQIPKENIRIQKYKKHGFGQSFSRSNYYEHGEKLLDQYDKLYSYESTKNDFDLASQLFFSIEIPEQRDIKSEKIKLQHLGINLISYSEKNASKGTAYIPKMEYKELIRKIKHYKESDEHTGKSYISIIENIEPIESGSKISSLNIHAKETISVIFSLFTTFGDFGDSVQSFSDQSVHLNFAKQLP